MVFASTNIDNVSDQCSAVSNRCNCTNNEMCSYFLTLPMEPPMRVVTALLLFSIILSYVQIGESSVIITNSWQWRFDASFSVSVPVATGGSWRVCLQFSAPVTNVQVIEEL